jgi:hypothetical protein
VPPPPALTPNPGAGRQAVAVDPVSAVSPADCARAANPMKDPPPPETSVAWERYRALAGKWAARRWADRRRELLADDLEDQHAESPGSGDDGSSCRVQGEGVARDGEGGGMADDGIQREVLPIPERRPQDPDRRAPAPWAALGSWARPQPGHRDLVPVHRRRDHARRRAAPPRHHDHLRGPPGRSAAAPARKAPAPSRTASSPSTTRPHQPRRPTCLSRPKT